MNELGLFVLGASARATVLALVGLAAVAALRRRAPSAGALAASTTLAVLAGLAAMEFSPWPRWWSEGGSRAARGPDPVAIGPGPSAPARSDTIPGAGAVGSSTSAAWSDFVREFGRELAGAGVSTRGTAWRWPAWAACAFLGGLAVGWSRLALGFWAVRSLRARGRPVVDIELLAAVESLRGEMGLRGPVEVRESAEVGTPATVGWRRPAILLPEGWRAWDPVERRAVLAHELAHIARGDYAIGLAAQVSLSIHFYHPMVHALARRLRLQQELAADAWGARLSGGRRPYLTALANLALRQDPRPAAWPARPFLPTRGTFLRRIEMLRDPRSLESPPMPARGRALTVSLIVAAGVTVAGLRGPGGPPGALAQEAPPQDKAGLTAIGPFPPALVPLDPAMSSSDVHLAVDFRPGLLLKNPDLRRLAAQLPADGPKLLAAIASGDIEQILILGSERNGVTAPPPLVTILRSTRPLDWRSLIAAKVAEMKADGFIYLSTGTIPGSTCYRILDDQTFLIGTEADAKVPPIGADRPRGRHSWDVAWKQLAPGAARVAFDTPWLVRQVEPNRPGPNAGLFRLLSPLCEKSQAYAMTLNAGDGLTLDALAVCGADDNAGRVADTLRAALTLARNSMPDLRLAAEKGPPGAARSLVDLVDALDAMLETAKVDQDRSVARLHARADAASLATAARMLLPAVGAAREAARRSQCINSLKQIGLAMHNYHQANGSLPPAVLYGPDSKTPYSWRVALLPYIEASEVYNQYKFDEPWDGPNNRKLILRMPAFFACPDDPQAVAAGHTSYFVLNGPDSLFPDRKAGVGFQEVLDGTSNTLMVVEARREIPWTKPEDIPYEAGRDLPPLGGTHPSGFDALFADGSVRFLKDTINQVLLRALISRAGGEIISADAY